MLQGVAGGVFPLAFGIVRDTFPRDQVAGGLAIISAIFGIGGGIGLPLSGVIVDNVDLALAVLDQPDRAAGGVRRAPARRRPRRRCENTQVDWLGAVAAVRAALAAILLGVSQAGEWGWGSPANVGCDRAAALVLIGAVRVRRGARRRSR